MTAPVARTLTLENVPAVALGAGVLGTGGGGNTYLGRIWLQRELRSRNHGCRIISADEVPDDALVCAVGGMGAPTVGVEKLPEGHELVRVLRALEHHLGERFAALVIGEIGGSNALRPLICGLQTDLPVVDGDGMGRAFPELQMDTFAIAGLPLSPLGLGDSHGNVVIFQHVTSPQQAEAYARSLTIELGGSAALAMPVMRGRDLKRTLIRGTLTLAQRLGEAVLRARHDGNDAAAAVAREAGGQVLFRGKITDVERRTTQGFARGRIRITAFRKRDESAGAPDPLPDMLPETLEIAFQNENLIAWHTPAGGGPREVICTVPDLITLLHHDDGEPIGTEMLRYGLRVAVLGIPAPLELTTPAALAVVGPAAFGYEGVAYRPLPRG